MGTIFRPVMAVFTFDEAYSYTKHVQSIATIIPGSYLKAALKMSGRSVNGHQAAG